MSISLLVLAFGSTMAQGKVTCKAEVAFHGQELTGLMMFKQVSEDTVRFAFYNELGMSYVEGSISVGSSQFAVRSSQFAVGSSQLAVRSSQLAVRSQVEIVQISEFLDYKSFRRYFEKGLNSFLWDKKEEKLILPVNENEKIEITRIYQRGGKFVFRLRLSE